MMRPPTWRFLGRDLELAAMTFDPTMIAGARGSGKRIVPVDNHRSAPKARRSWSRRVGLILGSLAVLLPAILTLGAYLPWVPYAGYGSLVLTVWPAWFAVTPLAGAVIVARTSRRRWVRFSLCAIAIVTALAAAFIIWRVVDVAHRNRVDVSVANAFGFSGSLATIQPDEIVPYEQDLGETLTLRIFKPRGPAPSGGWPVLMHIHGGGWVEGSNEQQSADMRWYANRGWIVVSAGYVLANGTRPTWDRVHGELGCAMSWIGRNIGRRGGNPTRLALRGGSAGGNLAINVGYMANASMLPTLCGGSVPKVRAIAAMYPGVDMAGLYDNPYFDTRSMVAQYIGGSPSQYPARYAATSSFTHINPFAPPTLVFISGSDHLVAPASMRAFARDARRAGVRVETIEVPFAEHGFDLMGLGNAIVRQTSLRFLNANDRQAPPARPARSAEGASE
jgi:acetyl esterase